MNNDNNKKQLLNNVTDKLEAAKLFHRSGKFEKAESLYREVLKEDPSNAEATHLLGLLAMQMGKFEIALYFFDTAILLDKERPEFYANKGTLFYLQGDLKKAKELLNKAIEMDPDYIEARANLGKILAQEGQFEDARNYLVSAVNRGDKDISTIITLAEVNFRLKLYHRAEELCKQMLDIGHEEDQILKILVDSLCKQKKYMEALPYAEILANRSKEIYGELLQYIYNNVKII